MTTGNIGVDALDGLQKFEAAHAGQLEIGDDEVEVFLVRGAAGRFRRRARCGRGNPSSASCSSSSRRILASSSTMRMDGFSRFIFAALSDAVLVVLHAV